MTFPLASYSTFESALLVKIVCDFYKANPADDYVSKSFLFSDTIRPLQSQTYDIVNGTTVARGAPDLYLPLGNFLSITNTTSEIKPSTGELTITISGIPNTSIYELINSKFKGSKVTISRAFFNSSDGSYIVDPNFNLDTGVGRFRGIVSNFTLTEDFNFDTRTSTNTITIICKSLVELLSKSTKGRRTNPDDEARFFPGDICFDKIPKLVGSSYNFGAEI
jgi:hypothetical protein